MSDNGEPFRSGFACFVGRPNAGKSTLTNAMVGEKIAITSNRPQTTRHAIRGIVHRTDGQLIVVDTPGLHRPRTLLGQRLNDVVRATWSEVDVVGVCIPANEPVGPGDRFIAGEMAGIRRTPKIAVVTKTDLVGGDRLMQQLSAVAALAEESGFVWADVVPVSATDRLAASAEKSASADRLAASEKRASADRLAASAEKRASADRDRVELLIELFLAQLPEGPPLYPEGELTDEPEETLVAELVREAALEGVRDELPHSIAVVVEEMIPREDRPADRPLLDVHVNLYVERDSQKAIVIGRKGVRLRDVGTRARTQIERLLGTPVYLDLHVKVAKDWQRDPKQLGRMGF